MHTPEHFINQTASVATSVLAAATLAVAVSRARGELLSANPDGTRIDVRARIAMTASVTGLIFATQMVNFPVSAGTSGHLLGGALAAVLLGPWLGLLSISLVLAVQAVVFADGGLSALGVNITLMGVVGVGVAWAVIRPLLHRSSGSGSVVRAATLGGLVSVPAAALAFVAVYAVGGITGVPLGALAVQMVGWHVLIGVGEAIITGLLVTAVMAINPNLVYAARRFTAPTPARVSVPIAVAAVATTAGVVAVALARFASPHPDGLVFVSQHLGLDVASGAHALTGSWLAGYGAVSGLDVGLAGLLGATITAALAMMLGHFLAQDSRPAGLAAPLL